MVRRLLAVAVVLGGAVLVAPGSGPSPVHLSANKTIACTFTGNGSVQPPATYKNGSVLKSYQFNGSSKCQGAASGSSSASGSGYISCVGGTSTASIHMPSGDVLSLSMTHNLNTFHGSGTVTSGPNAGAAASGYFTFYGTGAAGCATSGVSSANVDGVVKY